MTFQSCLTLAFSLLCFTSWATPLQTSVQLLGAIERTEVAREALSDGNHLVYYDFTPSTRLPSDSADDETPARCTSYSTPKCAGGDAARNELCEQLVTELGGNSQMSLPESPRQVCYEGGAAEKDRYCCVSWHIKVPGLTKGDLYDQALKIVKSCTQNGVAGRVSDVLVHGVCTDVCMSKKGTGC